MIGNINYDDYQKLITILETSSGNLKNIINGYMENDTTKSNAIKVNRFLVELDNYLEYLKSTYEINIDAEEAIKNLRELNS